MRAWLLLLLSAALAGCQVTPTTLPVAEPAPAAECRWPVGDLAPQTRMRRIVDALEAQDFLIRHTDLSLGLVSAERTSILPGYGDRHDRWESRGMTGSVGIGGGRGGVVSGVMIGFGGVGSLTRDATELERVSVLAGAEKVLVSRDLQVIDWRGELVEARSASDADFCRELRDAIEAVPPQEAS
ncbi:hypothetical protein [Halomonas daqiaonensis]|uniref:Uncharacterized protein n=1 Tax=Halomonas daqiaonensis TaxID=650850 RepID=A0A1H7RAH0_9GAMM|nr:hypothetical protein [Halomonas daqiaonensis]SEL57290.1 hypothetical protein SAMN04488129_11231 [Halomonas daqiaonensis]